MKLFFLIILLVAGLLLKPIAVYAYTQSDIVQRVDSDTKIANDLLAKVQAVKDDPNAILDVLTREILPVVQHWNESSSFYESVISTETNEELKTILTNIDNDIKGLSSSLLSVEESIKTGDKDTYSSALDQHDKQTESLNSDIKSLNNHFGVADYSWLLWPFLIGLIISTVLFIMSRGSPVLPAEQLRNKFEFALFKSSLWPLGGSAISYFWYIMTPPGGTFYMFYGLIGIGYFQFFRGLHSYITLARPAINLAKNEEKAKLEALIRSDKFQTESMDEEVKEIEKLSNDNKKCKECGTNNLLHAQYCKSCGSKF